MQPACGGPSNFLGSLHTRCGAVIAHGDTYNAKLASPGSVIRPGSLSLCELGSFSTPGDALQACQGALRLLKQTRGSVTPLLPLPAVAGGPGDVGHYGGGDMDTQSGEDGDCFPEPETSEDTQVNWASCTGWCNHALAVQDSSASCGDGGYGTMVPCW